MTAMSLVIDAVTRFYNCITIRGHVHGGAMQSVSIGGEQALVTVGEEPPNGYTPFTAQAIVAGDFPMDATVIFTNDAETETVIMGQMLASIEANKPGPMFGRFKTLVGKGTDDVKPAVLDIGGRARSGVLGASEHPDWATTVLDILPDEGVDVVGDAHKMASFLPAGSFDAAMSISVFEHLLMPWKVAVEMAKVLKVGGLAFVHSHHAIGLHDAPWDFWRFSDNAWKALFNKATGFEVIEIGMSEPLHLIPHLYHPRYAEAERSCGFLASAVLARKICEPSVDWEVDLSSAINTMYPEGANTQAIRDRAV